MTNVTVNFNGRALECDCSLEGSKDHHLCDSHGGQCMCKDHVIGRQCTRCEPEYFGFPDCQPCNCPETAQCDEEVTAPIYAIFSINNCFIDRQGLVSVLPS